MRCWALATFSALFFLGARAEGEEGAATAPRRSKPLYPYPMPEEYAPRTESPPVPPSSQSDASAPLERWRDPEPPPEAEPERRWYGWQTLAVDGTNVTLLLAAGALDESGVSPMLAFFGVTGLFFGPPILHWSHGHGGKGWASLALRLGGLIAFGAGVASCDGSTSWGCPLAFAGVASMLAAIPLDAAVIAREDVPRRRRDESRGGTVEWVGFVPMIDPLHAELRVQAVARF